MLKALLNLFTGDHPLNQATADFISMLEIVEGMLLEASEVYWGKSLSPEDRTGLYKRDVNVNKLERSVRKAIVTHLSAGAGPDVPYALRLMSVVKDVERLGDYAKNLAEVADIASGPFPESSDLQELGEIRRAVETLILEARATFVNDDVDRATELTIEGRAVSKRCDELVRKLALSEYSPPVVVALTLGTRFYKRVNGHLLNVLSGVLMPIHKLDYFDEKLLEGGSDA